MQALVIENIGAPEVLRIKEWPDPELKPGQVLVRVKAAGINFADCQARKGIYRDAPKRPFVPGYEIAGIIEKAANNVTQRRVGETVFGFSRFGGCAQYVAVDEAQVFPLPDGFNFEEAAAIPVNYATAYVALHIMARVRRDDRVLIHGAAGGVGIAALQLAKAAGAEIMATAGSQRKIEWLKHQGTTLAVNYRETDYAEALKNEKGISIILNAAGGETLKKDLKLLGPGGCVVSYGTASWSQGPTRNWFKLIGSIVKTPLLHPLWLVVHSKGFYGLSMLHYFRNTAVAGKIVNQLFDIMMEHKLKPVIDSVHPLKKAAEAHRRLEERQNIGKVILSL